MSAPDKTGVGSGSGDYGTPPVLYAQIYERYRPSYDAFASADNHWALLYSTARGTFMSYAHEDEDVLVWPEDGLRHSWAGHRVFLNPPYGRGWLRRVVEKCIAERNEAEIIVALLPVDTGTKWWRLLEQHADIEFLPKRVKFVHPGTPCVDKNGKECTHALNEPATSPPSANCIAVFRRDWIVP